MKRFIKTNSGLYNQNVKLISAHNTFFLQKYFLKWCCAGVVEPMNIRVSITFLCLKKNPFLYNGNATSFLSGVCELE